MTDIAPDNITICGSCDNTSEQPIVRSTNYYGKNDLDLRPPPDDRGFLSFYIMKCPHCGYCSTNISSTSCVDDIINIKSEKYLQILKNEKPNEVARKYLAYSYLLEKRGEINRAAEISLCAAWCCDDEKDSIGADSCRKESIRLFNLISGNLPPNDYQTLVDLYRRTSEFETAMNMCKDGLKTKRISKDLKNALNQEIKQIAMKNNACVQME